MPIISNLSCGILTSIFSASFFGCVNSFARMSYEEGSNSLTVGIFRSLFGVLLCLILALASNYNLKIKRTDWPGICIVAVGTSGIALCYLTAVNYIPVALAALLFFTWPILLIAYIAIRQPNTVPVSTWGFFIVAFAGIALVIGPVFTSLNPFGIFLSIGAAISGTAVFLFSQKYIINLNIIVSAFWINILVLIILSTITLTQDALQIPQSERGLFAMLAASACYSIGLVMMFFAIKQIGVTKSALYFNLEPLVASLVAAILLKEYLSTVQLMGFAVVMCVIFATSMTKEYATQSSKL